MIDFTIRQGFLFILLGLMLVHQFSLANAGEVIESEKPRVAENAWKDFPSVHSAVAEIERLKMKILEIQRDSKVNDAEIVQLNEKIAELSERVYILDGSVLKADLGKFDTSSAYQIDEYFPIHIYSKSEMLDIDLKARILMSRADAGPFKQHWDAGSIDVIAKIRPGGMVYGYEIRDKSRNETMMFSNYEFMTSETRKNIESEREKIRIETEVKFAKIQQHDKQRELDSNNNQEKSWSKQSIQARQSSIFGMTRMVYDEYTHERDNFAKSTTLTFTLPVAFLTEIFLTPLETTHDMTNSTRYSYSPSVWAKPDSMIAKAWDFEKTGKPNF